VNIAMFTNTYYPSVGGIEKSIDIFAEEMRRCGHRVLIVAPEYEGASLSTDDVLRVPAIKRINGSPHSVVLGFPSELVMRVRDFRPDIIHSHQPFLLGDSAVRMARLLDVPIVYTHHTFMERYLHWFPVNWRLLRDIALKLPVAYANLVDYVVTPTRSVAEIMRQRGVKTPLSAIPTGINADFFRSGNRSSFRQRCGLADEHFVIGHLGRLNEEKNLAYLADVVVEFIARRPDIRRFLLAGEGDLVHMFKQRFAAYGLAEHLIFTGLLHGQACADAYAAMDIFIFTSHSDTQGLVLSEAMAAGTPIFALDATGARDMVTHDVSGYLLPADATPQEFCAKMEHMIAQPQRLNAMRHAAVQATGAMSIPVCTQQMLNLYSNLVCQKGVSIRDGATRWDQWMRQWNVEMELMQEKIGCLMADEMK
jgi:glycosyltransferase involved in cell wall biosynthesis